MHNQSNKLIDFLRSQLFVDYCTDCCISAFIQSHTHTTSCVFGLFFYFLHTTYWIIYHNASCFIEVVVLPSLIVDVTTNMCRRWRRWWKKNCNVCLGGDLHYDTQPSHCHSHTYSMFLLAVFSLRTILSLSGIHLRCTHVGNWLGRK